MVTNANIAELNTNNTTMKLEEIREIKPDKEFQELFAAIQPKALFIPLVKARRPPHGISMPFEPIDIKPFPTEPSEEEPAEPKVFRKTITFKMTEKDKRAFMRTMRRHCKIPRKLKKAGRHIYLPYSKPTIYDTVRQPDGTVSCIGYVSGYRIKPGYPHTKWARKALARINRSVERSIKELLKNNEKPCHNT